MQRPFLCGHLWVEIGAAIHGDFEDTGLQNSLAPCPWLAASFARVAS
jgi:hypothetical protein